MKTSLYLLVILATAVFAADEKKTEKRGILGLGYGGYSGLGYGGLGYSGLGYGAAPLYGHGLYNHGLYSHGLPYTHAGLGHGLYGSSLWGPGPGLHGYSAPLHYGSPWLGHGLIH